MRHRGASIFIYLIFGLLILIFVINFAPQGGRGGGCSTGSNTIVEVDGSKASKAAYHVAYSNPYNQGRSRDRVYRALELVIRRELLADAADARGIRVTRELLDEEIKKGFFFIGGYRVPLDEQIFDKHEDGSKIWNLGKFKRWVQMLDVSQNSYIDEQMRSYQAALMSELLSSSARVSRDEALQDYLFEHNTVTYDVVAFEPSAYRAAMRLTDADIARFLADHEQDVQAKYKADERTYKGVKPQLKLREIFIAKAEPAAANPPAEPGKPAPAAAKPEPAAKPVGLPIEEAKAKLEAARTAIEAKKQTFADAAKQLNTDEALKASGGELGWRSVENAQLGDKAVNDAVKALKPGEMTPVITTDRGAYVVLAEDKREGDLSYDQVKHELAADLAREVWSKEAAKRDALKALDEARAGTGKNLDQMFERAAEQPSGDGGIMQLLNDPSIPEETKRQIIEQIQRKQAAGGQQGSIEVESRDIPASWKADETTGAGATAPAAGSAAPAAGGADPAAAAGSAPATATTTAAPAPAELT
ncbi:MAG: peptidylprolyl isomerase, partial [Kofleriaceae bacterium]